MKTTGPNPPPALAAAFARLVSVGGAGGSAAGTARTRRGARYRAPRPKSLPTNRAIWAMCQDWAIAYADLNQRPIDPLFAKARYDEAIARTYPPRWWHVLPASSVAYWTSTPTSTENLNPPPYAYRDQTNRPSTPTYPLGVAGSAPPRSSGQTAAQIYADGPLTWAAYDFTIPPDPGTESPSHAIIDAQYTLAVSTDARASRPMFSILARLAQGQASDPLMSAATPPVASSFGLYTRYRPPTSPPPYYSASKPDSLHTARKISRIDGAADEPEIFRLSLAPRPMFGIGYNNCTQVEQTLALPTAPSIILPRFAASDDPFYCVNQYPVTVWNPRTGRSWTPPGSPNWGQGSSGAGETGFRWGGPGYQIIDYSRRVLASITYSSSPPLKDVGSFYCAEGYALMRERVDPNGFTITGRQVDVFDHFGLHAATIDYAMGYFGFARFTEYSHAIGGGMIATDAATKIHYWPLGGAPVSCYYQLPAAFIEWHHAAGAAWLVKQDRSVWTAPLPTAADCSDSVPTYDRWTKLADLPLSAYAYGWHPSGLIAFRSAQPPLVLSPDGTTTAGSKLPPGQLSWRWPFFYPWASPLLK